MSVTAVTPRVTAISGHLQFWSDVDGYDLEQDSRWDEVDPSGFYPDTRLEDFRRGSNGQRARGARPVATPMNAVPGHTAGCHRRPGTATSSQAPALPSGAGEPTKPPGGGLVGPTLGRARTEPSPRGTGAAETPSDEQSRPGWSPDGS